MAKVDYKAGSIELTEAEVNEYYNNGQIYLVSYRKVFQIFWSNAQGRFYFPVVYHHSGDLPLTKRGHFFAMNAKGVNGLIDHPLFNEN